MIPRASCPCVDKAKAVLPLESKTMENKRTPPSGEHLCMASSYDTCKPLLK